MRTTIKISDALLEKAKRLAARENRTLGELIELALQDRLRQEPAQAKAVPFRLLTFGDGGLQPGLTWERLKDLTDVEEAERLVASRASRAADSE